MNTTELKALAEKATPGPWMSEGHTIFSLMHFGWRKGVEQFKNRFWMPVYKDCECPEEERKANVDFVTAANPAAILELIAQLEDAQGEIRALRATEQNLRERVKEFEKGLRRATDALDLLTDKVDGTGFAESDEFNNALDEIDLGRSILEKT